MSASSPSCLSEDTLPSYRSSLSAPSPVDKKRESIWSIIASYAQPSTPNKPIIPLTRREREANTKWVPQTHRFPRRLILLEETQRQQKKKHEYPPMSTFANNLEKWEWSAPVSGEEEGKVVVKGEGDVFTRIIEMESRLQSREEVPKAGAGRRRSEWEPVTEGRKVSLQTKVGLAQTFVVMIYLALLLLVLLSPTATLPNYGLLVLHLDDNRTVTLGPIGACYGKATSSARSCTKTSLTPTFSAIYSTLSLPSSITSSLPFSFPLFPTTLVVSSVILSVSLVLLALINFPRRGNSPSSIDPRKLALVAAGVTTFVFVLGMSATIAQRLSLSGATDPIDWVAKITPLSAVEIGTGFNVLWTVWGLLGLTMLSWGLQGEGEKKRGEQRDEKAEV